MDHFPEEVNAKFKFETSWHNRQRRYPARQTQTKIRRGSVPGQKGGGIICTSKTSWLNGTGQKGGGIIYTSKTSWLNGTAQKGGGIIYTSKTSWLNGTGQKSDVIICTRKTPSALSRWALSYNMQSRIASQTREVFCADPDDGIDHNEHNRGRRGQVKTDVDNLLTP